MNEKEIIEEAIALWSTEGRTEEQLYGVQNFMTGKGLGMMKRFKSQILKEIGDFCDKELIHMHEHSSGNYAYGKVEALSDIKSLLSELNNQEK